MREYVNVSTNCNPELGKFLPKTPAVLITARKRFFISLYRCREYFQRSLTQSLHRLYKNGTVYEVGFKLVKRSDTAFFREIVCMYLVHIYFFLCYWVECISHLYNMYGTYCTLLVVAKTAYNAYAQSYKYSSYCFFYFAIYTISGGFTTKRTEEKLVQIVYY